MVPTASNTVFEIPELLDAILASTNLKMRAFLKLRLVRSNWRVAVDTGSLEVQQALFLAPIPLSRRSYLLEEVLDESVDWNIPKKISSTKRDIPGYRFICTASQIHPAINSLRPATSIDRDSSVFRMPDDQFTRWYTRLPGSVRQWKHMLIVQPPPTSANVSFEVCGFEKQTIVARSTGIRVGDVSSALGRLRKAFKESGKKGAIRYEEITLLETAVYDDIERALGLEETYW
jgi:hypothetical protein